MSKGHKRRSRRSSRPNPLAIGGVAIVAALALGLTGIAVYNASRPVSTQAQPRNVEPAPSSSRTVPTRLQAADVLPRLDDQTRPFTIVVFGDSTGVSRNGWPVHLADWLGTTYDRTTIVHPWDGTPGTDQYQAANWTIHSGKGAKVEIYNASVSSTAAEYPMSRLDKMVPIDGNTVDMVLVNYGHNQTDANMVTQGSALVSESSKRFPNAAVLSFLQNSERENSPHAKMLTTANFYWKRWLEGNGYGYVDIQSVFDRAEDRNAILSDDGDIHPNDAGYKLWADTLTEYLESQR